MRTFSFALAAAVAIVFAPAETAAHHGKKEEHAQPAAARSGCMWTRAGKAYKSHAACMKGTGGKGSCRSSCK